MFYTGSAFYHPGSRILHEKWNANIFFSLAFPAFRSKVLVIVKEIQNPEKIHLGSGSRGEKASDPGSGSAALVSGFELLTLKINSFEKF
jgi:hypothetical protein